MRQDSGFLLRKIPVAANGIPFATLWVGEKWGNRERRVPEQGRFMLEGVHFSWWVGELAVTVSSLLGRENLQLNSDACPETAAHRLARQLLSDADESSG